MKKDELYKKMKAAYERSFKHDAGETLFDILGIGYKEVYISKWLAYLLNEPKILNALLKAAKYEEIVVSNSSEIVIETEHVFDDSRRIDLLIKIDGYLIGIEHKICAQEGSNQTKDYSTKLKEMAKEQKMEWKGIFLRPEWNDKESESSDFHDVTYTVFYEQLKHITLEDKMMQLRLNEYRQLIREKLLDKYIASSEAIELYARHKAVLEKDAASEEWLEEIKNEYEQIEKQRKAFLRKHLKEKGYELFQSDFKNGCFIQFAPDSKWNNNNYPKFHFELLWGNKKSLFINITDLDFLCVAAHIESIPNSQEIKNHVKNYFGSEKIRRSGNPFCDKSLEKWDFSTKESAEASIDDLIQIVKSDKFQEFTEKVEEYLST